MSEDLKDKVEKLYKKGTYIKEIVRELKISTNKCNSILQWLTEKGRIERRNAHKRGIPMRPTAAMVLHKAKINSLPDVEWNYIPKIGISIMELTHKTCRFPCANGVYCGGNVHKRGYCEDHYNVAWE